MSSAPLPASPYEIAREVLALAEKATPGPWRWNLSLKGKRVVLEGNPRRGSEVVMDFWRWGMSGATPAFRVDGIMRNAHELTAVVPEREHHESWYRTVDHPDANLIAHCGTHYAALARELLRVAPIVEELDDARRQAAEFDPPVTDERAIVALAALDSTNGAAVTHQSYFWAGWFAAVRAARSAQL